LTFKLSTFFQVQHLIVFSLKVFIALYMFYIGLELGYFQYYTGHILSPLKILRKVLIFCFVLFFCTDNWVKFREHSGSTIFSWLFKAYSSFEFVPWIYYSEISLKTACVLSHVQLLVTLWHLTPTLTLTLTRLLCLGDLPGMNTGVDCHFLFQGNFLTNWVMSKYLGISFCAMCEHSLLWVIPDICLFIHRIRIPPSLTLLSSIPFADFSPNKLQVLFLSSERQGF